MAILHNDAAHNTVSNEQSEAAEATEQSEAIT